MREAAIRQPELKLLRCLLLKFGGSYIVAPPAADPDLPIIVSSGFLMHGPVKFKKMRSSLCHQNVAALWRKQAHDMVAIATGYALSSDGLWRQHSWGLLRNGVLETTEERTKYFGILLSASGADHFAACNLCDAV